MAKFFKNQLIGFLSDPAEEVSQSGSKPEQGQEKSELQDRRGAEAAQLKAKERGMRGGETEVLAKANFRTIVRDSELQETGNAYD